MFLVPQSPRFFQGDIVYVDDFAKARQILSLKAGPTWLEPIMSTVRAIHTETGVRPRLLVMEQSEWDALLRSAEYQSVAKYLTYSDEQARSPMMFGAILGLTIQVVAPPGRIESEVASTGSSSSMSSPG